MRTATRRTISTFGVVAAIAGLEHGIGEILQGNTAPESMFILSWPGSEFFDILAGEPAMTLIPNLLVSGVLTVLLALLFLGWATLWLKHKESGWALLLLSVALLLVGGGFGPPILGTILAIATLRMHAAQAGGARYSPELRKAVGSGWLWLYAICLGFWLLLFPGVNMLDTLFNVPALENYVIPIGLSAFGTLLLALTSAFARDSLRQDSGRAALRSAGAVS